MGFKYRWRPSASQKRAYHEKMVAIEEAKNEYPPEEFTIDCTGDCCTGDEIVYFNAGKTSERLTGVIVSESYGDSKQQHTFTILLVDGTKQLIKGRNLYKNGVYRKKWENEEVRKALLEEKHKRGDIAREAAARKALRYERMDYEL